MSVKDYDEKMRDLARKSMLTGETFRDKVERAVIALPGGVQGEVFVNGDGKIVRSVTDGVEYPTEAARYIVERLIPEWVALFLEKNAGYGNMHGDLGLRAQYVDIHRKTGKLRRAWWDGKDIGPETPRE